MTGSLGKVWGFFVLLRWDVYSYVDENDLERGESLRAGSEALSGGFVLKKSRELLILFN